MIAASVNAAMLAVLLGLRSEYDGDRDTFAALDVGQGQCLAALSGTEEDD